MATAKDLTGLRFGKLTITSRAPSRTRPSGLRVVAWNATCDCGKSRVVLATSLRPGAEISCGAPEHRFKTNALENRYLNSYKTSAKNRGHFWDLTDEQVLDLSKQDCFYCGTAPKDRKFLDARNAGNNDRTIQVNGIDRTDPTKGYTEDNVLPCCGTCNYMKGSLQKDEFLQHIERVAKFNS